MQQSITISLGDNEINELIEGFKYSSLLNWRRKYESLNNLYDIEWRIEIQTESKKIIKHGINNCPSKFEIFIKIITNLIGQKTNQRLNFL